MEEETEDDNFTLTSFEPLSPEYKKSGFSRFIEGFTWKKLTSNTNDVQDPVRLQRDQNHGLQEGSKRNVRWKAPDSKFVVGESSKGPPTKIVVSSDRHSRTPSSVLKRLSLLISVERTSLQPSQSSSNLKKYWMPDEQCKVCYECGVKFHTFRRRHHCRLCGQIFCSRCCNEEFSGQQTGYTGVLRVCVYCKKIVLAYTSSSDVDKNLKQLKHDLSLVAQPDNSNGSASSEARSSSFDDSELNHSFDVLGVSAKEANLLKQDSFKELWQQITAPKTGIELQSHRVRLRTYSNCLVGRELVDWLVFHRKVPNRPQALQISQIFLDSGWIEPLLNPRDTVFKDDFVLYASGRNTAGDASFPARYSPLSDFVQSPSGNYPFVFDNLFVKKKRKESPRNESVPNLSESYNEILTGTKRGLRKMNSASNLQNTDRFLAQFQKKSLSCEDLRSKVDAMENEENKDKTTEPASPITQSAVLDHFVRVDDCYLPKSQASKQADGATGNAEKGAEKNVDNVTKDGEKEMENGVKKNQKEMENAETAALDQLSSIHSHHISSFLTQLLDRVGLNQTWRAVIEPLALKVSETVVPDVVHNDDMDIRQYVKIKKILGGEKSDCRIVNGVVCTKNVVHKKMAKSITEPHILMLACPVDFQRVENRLASLEPIVLQEEEFLKNYVGRIAALNPTIVLVEKTVSRLAQEMLLARGVSVMLNVKPELMKRISRCTEGDVLPSLDQGSRPNLGTCRKFKIEKFVFKNGTTKTLAFFEGCPPRLGSTIVIRGGDMIELSKVKHILRFMIFVAYNSVLEKAFIMDEFGTPSGIENGKDDEMGEREENHEKEQIEGAVGGKGVLVEKERKCLDDEFEATHEEEGMEGEEEGHEEGKEGVHLPLTKERVLLEKGGKDKESAEGIEVINQRSSSNNDHFSEDRIKSTVVNRESFEKVMNTVILCSSPLITYPVPYILTNEGQRCQLLTYMEENLYWSPLFNDDVPSEEDGSPEVHHLDDVNEPESKSIYMRETHPFIFAVLTKDARDLEARTLLAHFRADGGRISLRRRQNDGSDEQKVEVEQNGVDSTDGIRKTKGAKETDRVFVGQDRSNEEFQNTLSLRRDCFDPFLHQMIAILFCSYSIDSANFPHSCISPWTVFMEFYAKKDIALGCFLERYCFWPSYLCPNPNCDVPMVKHVRYFAHGNGAVYINMKNLEAPIPGFAKTLLTWSWCKQCEQVTPLVPVSPKAWRLSFAKYLELRMYGSCYRRRTTVAPCEHSLHQDHHQYFAYNNIVASFKYLPVKIYEVFLPPTAITLLEEERQPQFWITHIQEMSVRVHQLVSSINERIAMLKTEPFISNCVTESGHDQGQLQEKIKVLERKAMLLLNPPPSPGEKDDNKWLEPDEMSSLEYEILDGLTLLKRMMCEYREKWNTQLLKLVHLENEKKKSKPVDVKSHISVPASNQSPNDDSIYSNWSSVTQSETKMSPSDSQDMIKISQKSFQSPEAIQTTTNHSVLTLIESEHTSSTESEPKVDTLNGTRGSSSSSDKKFQRHSELWATLSKEVNSTRTDSQLPEDRPGSTLTRIKQLLPGTTLNPIRPPFPPHEHHMLPSSEVIPIVVNEKELTSIIAYTLSTIDYKKKLHKIQDSMMDLESVKESFTCVDMDVNGLCRISTTSSDGIPTRNRTRSEVETISTTSLLATLDDFVDNYFECFDSDNEESNSKNDSKNTSTDAEASGDKNFENNSSDIKDGQTASTAVGGKEQPSNISPSTQEEVEYHIRHSFSDSTAKFFCVVYFGEQFRRIRRTLFPGGEEKYIRSLQYCLEWRAKGGKSGSSFCKTKDDRFVIKEMSRSEAQSFLDIAPFYFEYIEKSTKQKKPTLLAKILGVYRIGCTSKLTNAPIRQDLLVMDNLLYNYKVDKVFDLKGSIRSRYVMSSEQNNVLLDENLLETIAESPLFIRPHSKAVLLKAIHRDTEFLARHMVMDYSLLLGIEEDTSKLVVGIIDFIRTFTWDKKLEMYVKSTGILGGQGKMPTVVSPELYRERFCEAMQQYFLMIPNKWMGLGNELK